MAKEMTLERLKQLGGGEPARLATKQLKLPNPVKLVNSEDSSTVEVQRYQDEKGDEPWHAFAQTGNEPGKGKWVPISQLREPN